MVYKQISPLLVETAVIPMTSTQRLCGGDTNKGAMHRDGHVAALCHTCLQILLSVRGVQLFLPFFRQVAVEVITVNVKGANLSFLGRRGAVLG